MIRPVPSPPGNFLFGHLLHLKKNPIEYFNSTAFSLGKIFKLRVGFKEYFFLTHPDPARFVLMDHYEDFDKKSREWDKIKLLLGNGVLTTDGAPWKRQRRILQPHFRMRSIVKFTDFIIRETQSFAKRWERFAQERTTFNLHEEMMALTFRIIAQFVFSESLNENIIKKFQEDFAIVLQYGWKSSIRIFNLPLWIPFRSHRKITKALNSMHFFVDSIIKNRRKQNNTGNDLLSELLQAQDPETGEKMSDREIRDQAMAILMAGHETTAIALTFSWILLAQHPDIQENLYKEAAAFQDPKLLAQQSRYLSLAHNVMQETMRLYPPVWGIYRRTIKNTLIGDSYLPGINLSLY